MFSKGFFPSNATFTAGASTRLIARSSDRATSGLCIGLAHLSLFDHGDENANAEIVERFPSA